MAIFKSMLLKLLQQHYQIYVLLFYYGLIIIITGISDLRGGSWSVVGLIHLIALQRNATALLEWTATCSELLMIGWKRK